MRSVFGKALGFLLQGAVFTAIACTVPHSPDAATRTKEGENAWATPNISGTWYAPSRDGEGIVLEYLHTGRVMATWFTYPANGESGEQAWLSAQGGEIDGDTLRFASVFKPEGGRFGPAFDPAAITLTQWGTIELKFIDCNNATLSWSGPPEYGSGSHALIRLTALDELECSGARQLTSNGGRALDGLRARSGIFYVPSRSGEGWFIEELPNGNVQTFWFTYTPEGEQAWTIGVANRNGNRYELPEAQITRGTNFGTGFSSADVERVPWGRMDFTFDSCDAVTVDYASSIPGYGSGRHESTRLTRVAGTVCLDNTPLAKTGGSWRAEPAAPLPAQSELAATVLGSSIYTMGGFGDLRGFKRFDTATAQWSDLPDLPGGRDHLSAFAIEGSIYMNGGEAQGGVNTNSGHRFDFAAQQWQPVPALTYTYGSQAAVVDGRAYLGNDDGSLIEFDPVNQRTRIIARPPTGVGRDHANVVAFLGEIWVMAGRSPETTSTAIYDPASSRWRAGPLLSRLRGGFAAAVVGDQIMVSGGEVIGTLPFRIEPSTEVYAAGTNSWVFGVTRPAPVHGVAGASINGRFYTLGGSTRAGAATGQTGETYSIEPLP